MTRRTFLAVCALSWLSGPTALGGDETIRAGDHYRVICHFKNDEIASAALSTAEAVWPIAEELFGFKETAPRSPLEIHLYRSAGEYEQAEAKIAGGRFRMNLAFSDAATRSAHVAVQPDCSDEALRAVGLNAQTRRLIAHEAAHLHRYATLPNSPSHPEWLATGAAAWIADEVMTRGGFSLGAERDPLTATYIVWAQRLVEERKLPRTDAILRDELGELPKDTQYGLRWLFFRFMQSSPRRDAWKKVLADARRLGGGSDYSDRLYKATTEILGPGELARIDEDFRHFLLSLKPQWEQTYRTLEPREEVWVQMAFPDTNALAWRIQPAGKEEYQVSGSLQILPGSSQQLNLLLGRTDAGFVSVAFVAGFGVTVFEYHGKQDDHWERLGSVQVKDVDLNRWVRFRVGLQKGSLQVEVNGRSVLTCPLRGRSMSGPWGVGAQAGSAGQWRDLALDR